MAVPMRLLGLATGLLVVTVFCATQTTGQEPPPPASTDKVYNSTWDMLIDRSDLSLFKGLVEGMNDTAFWSDTSRNISSFIPSNTAVQTFLDAHPNSSGFVDAWRLLTRYHATTTPFSAENNINFYFKIWPANSTSILLTPAIQPRTWYQPLVATLYRTADANVKGPSGSPAKITDEVALASGGYVHVIDNVLQYWFSSVADALDARSMTKMLAVVQSSTDVSNSLATLATASTPPLATLFVPNDQVRGTILGDNQLKTHLVPDDSVAVKGQQQVTSASGVILNVGSTVNAFGRYVPTTVTPSVAGAATANVVSEMGHVGFGPAIYLYDIDTVLQDQATPSPSPSPSPRPTPSPGDASAAGPCLWLTSALLVLAVGLLSPRS